MSLCACQPTPEEPPVIGKAGDYLDAACEIPFMHYEAPSRINESEEISGLELKIDARVIIPDTDGYSVMEVIGAFSKAVGNEIPYEITGRRAGDIPACYANPHKAGIELLWTAQKGLDQMCGDSWNWQKKNPAGYG
jgi:hypothetical protein